MHSLGPLMFAWLFHYIPAVSTLEKTIVQLTKRLESLECGGKTTATATTSTSGPISKSQPDPMEEDDDDDEVDLFGSDDEEVGLFCHSFFEERSSFSLTMV